MVYVANVFLVVAAILVLLLLAATMARLFRNWRLLKSLQFSRDHVKVVAFPHRVFPLFAAAQVKTLDAAQQVLSAHSKDFLRWIPGVPRGHLLTSEVCLLLPVVTVKSCRGRSLWPTVEWCIKLWGLNPECFSTRSWS